MTLAKAAYQELAKRELARRKYRFYLETLFPETPLAAHHLLIVEKLQAMADGKLDRLMLFLPPGSAKSTYANGRFLPWVLGRTPHQMAITASHTAAFADKWGRRSRTIATRPEYVRVFATHVKSDVKSAHHWMLENGSEYMAIGVGGAVTGNRADWIVVDDPVKGREDADSKTSRDKVWDWWLEDVKTRLKPGGKMVLIMTRWHEDDLAGRILARQSNSVEKWEVVSLPAECESAEDPLGRKFGEMLWPEYFTPEMFAEAKQSPRTWASLYQQRPAPEEGSFFQKSWFQTWKTLPQKLRYYGASDYAVTDKDGDYTVHVVAGYSDAGDLYITDLWRSQSTSSVWIGALVKLLKQYEPHEWAEENGAILKALDPFIRKTLIDERIYKTHRRQFTPTQDKVARARILQGMMQLGKVFFPPFEKAHFRGELENELVTFPAGKHDDQVDAISTLCRLTDTMKKPGTKKRPREMATAYNPYGE